MAEPAISDLVLPKLTERLARTTSADLPRLAGFDQEALRELRTPRAVRRDAAETKRPVGGTSRLGDRPMTSPCLHGWPLDSEDGGRHLPQLR